MEPASKNGQLRNEPVAAKQLKTIKGPTKTSKENGRKTYAP